MGCGNDFVVVESQKTHTVRQILDGIEHLIKWNPFGIGSIISTPNRLDGHQGIIGICDGNASRVSTWSTPSTKFIDVLNVEAGLFLQLSFGTFKETLVLLLDHQAVFVGLGLDFDETTRQSITSLERFNASFDEQHLQEFIGHIETENDTIGGDCGSWIDISKVGFFVIFHIF